ncbi:MAG TPA: FkbM family methyltransferase [Candidatus Acidoferrum sp.]|nr:FkbM family methyltransferase [Candidatus Acidoferrum sp.]
MRLKELFYLAGLRPRTRVYGHRIQTIDLPRDGRVEYARWLAPNASDLILRQEELDELRTFLQEGDLAIDIGAAVGNSTLPMALVCGGSGAVIAFEPNPFTFAILGANAALNPGRTNIIPIPYAATESDSTVVFDYGDPWFANGGDHTGVSPWRHASAFSIPVEGRRIEPLIRARFADRLRRLRYIKTDAEGHDLAVLRSIEGLIREFHPFIKSEVGKYAPAEDRQSMFRLLAGHGYVVRRLEHGSLFGPVLGEADMLQGKSFDIFAVPG